MIKGLLGKKIGMTQIFDGEGNVVPVTVVEAGPCSVLEIKESPKKVTIGFDDMKESHVRKTQLGLFKKLQIKPKRLIKEFASSDNKDYKVGGEIKADVFKPGDYVDVSGVSIGKGFQGGMKRWNWSGGPAAHGSMHHRRIGSIGASSDPSRVLKGTNMPGHMGSQRVTTQNLRIMDVDVENNVILIKGAVPGHKNSFVTIRIAKKKKWKDLNVAKAVVKHKANPMKQSKAGVSGKAPAKKGK